MFYSILCKHYVVMCFVLKTICSLRLFVFFLCRSWGVSCCLPDSMWMQHKKHVYFFMQSEHHSSTVCATAIVGFKMNHCHESLHVNWKLQINTAFWELIQYQKIQYHDIDFFLHLYFKIFRFLSQPWAVLVTQSQHVAVANPTSLGDTIYLWCSLTSALNSESLVEVKTVFFYRILTK